MRAVVTRLVFLQSCLKTSIRSLYQIVRHVSSEKSVPYGEEWLRIVVFCALELMVDVMIGSVVLEENMEDIARQPESTMIVHSFDHCKTEENYSCSCSHPRNKEREGSTKGVKQKTLEWVIVKGSNCVRNN